MKEEREKTEREKDKKKTENKKINRKITQGNALKRMTTWNGPHIKITHEIKENSLPAT